MLAPETRKNLCWSSMPLSDSCRPIPKPKKAKKAYIKNKLQSVWSRWQIRAWGMYWCQNLANGPIPCMHCGKISGLVADHVMPRSNKLHGDPWDPKNGAILCHLCNFDKGSRHGESLDYRPQAYKAFQKALADKEWEMVYGKWRLKQ